MSRRSWHRLLAREGWTWICEAVVDTAVRAARLIGDGHYGVDLKETDAGVVVIEVNDNPNLEHAIEGVVLKDRLWREIVNWFATRLESRLAGR